MSTVNWRRAWFSQGAAWEQIRLSGGSGYISRWLFIEGMLGLGVMHQDDVPLVGAGSTKSDWMLNLEFAVHAGLAEQRVARWLGIGLALSAAGGAGLRIPDLPYYALGVQLNFAFGKWGGLTSSP